MVLPNLLHRKPVVALAIVGGFVLALVIGWGFGQQLALARRIKTEEQRLQQMVADEQARHDVLVARLEYVRSEEYVEHWARAKMRMAKPGEVAVVPVRDASRVPIAAPAPAPPPEPEPRPFWAKLWDLAFGERP